MHFEYSSVCSEHAQNTHARPVAYSPNPLARYATANPKSISFSMYSNGSVDQLEHPLVGCAGV